MGVNEEDFTSIEVYENIMKYEISNFVSVLM